MNNKIPKGNDINKVIFDEKPSFSFPPCRLQSQQRLDVKVTKHRAIRYVGFCCVFEKLPVVFANLGSYSSSHDVLETHPLHIHLMSSFNAKTAPKKNQQTVPR